MPAFRLLFGLQPMRDFETGAAIASALRGVSRDQRLGVVLRRVDGAGACADQCVGARRATTLCPMGTTGEVR